MIDSYMRYGALAAKVKALYGKRLRFSDFEHMAGLPNEQSILDYLRTQERTPFAFRSGGSTRDSITLSPAPTRIWWHFPCGRRSCWPS